MPRKTDSHNPKDWVWIAESDLSGVRALATQELAFVMCRSKLAEVLEKTLKAELIRTGGFSRKHTIYSSSTTNFRRAALILPR